MTRRGAVVWVAFPEESQGESLMRLDRLTRMLQNSGHGTVLATGLSTEEPGNPLVQLRETTRRMLQAEHTRLIDEADPLANAIRVEHTHHTVSQRDHRVRLSPTAWATFTLLLQAGPRGILADTLADAVFGHTRNPAQNAAVAISRLRTQLGPIGYHLHTIPAGWTFRPGASTPLLTDLDDNAEQETQAAAAR